jgi:hypothetical protein
MVARVRLLARCGCGVLASCPPVLAQQQSTINGRVVDSAGLALPVQRHRDQSGHRIRTLGCFGRNRTSR